MVGSASVLHITSIYNMVEENMTCFMQRKGENPMVFVLDTNKRPLAPCHEAVARKLLKQGKAAIYNGKGVAELA